MFGLLVSAFEYSSHCIRTALTNAKCATIKHALSPNNIKYHINRK